MIDRSRERLANTEEDAQRVLRILRDSDDVTIDTETSGLSWKRHHVVGYVLTFRDEDSYYIPVRHAGGGNLPGCSVPMTAEGWRGDLHWFEIELAKIARERPRHWVGHNLLFDLRFCMKHGIELYGTKEDTSINAPLLDENQYSYALDKCALRENVQPKKGIDLYQYMASIFGGEPDKKQMENFWRTDASVPVVWQYAAGDGVTTEELLDAQRPQIQEEDKHGRSLVQVHSVECRLIHTLARMTGPGGGVCIDEERLHRADRLFEKRAAEASSDFPKDFNSKSPTQLKAYLDNKGLIGDNWPRNLPTTAEIKKAKNEGREPIGALKFDADTLRLIPEGDRIILFRQLTNARTLYTGPMMNYHLYNGHVYCDFAQMASDDYGTISGRLSCYDPNLQAVSKRNKKVGPVYRACFVPDPGCTWEDNDYSQQEYVVFTDYTEDPNLMAGYAATPAVDIHTVVAQMLGVERDPTAKRMNLGMLYGMGIAKLALSLGVSEQQAREWMDLYHKRFPYAKPFLKTAEKKARARGFVFTKLGRRRHFPDARFAHKAGNAIIQGSSADITKLKMVEIDEYFESEGDICRLMLQIHDSLSWSAEDSEAGRKQTTEARRIMTDFYSDEAVIKLKADLRIDAASGTNWAEATWSKDVVEAAWA